MQNKEPLVWVVLIVGSWYLTPYLSKAIKSMLYPSTLTDWSFVMALGVEIVILVLVYKFYIRKVFPRAQQIDTIQTPVVQPNRMWLKVLSFGYAALIPIALFIAAFAFDGTPPDFLTFLYATLLAISPVVLLVASIGGFKCSAGELTDRKKWWGKVFAVLPILNLLLFIVVAILVGAT